MIKIASINKNNFIRWYENTTPTLANSTYTTGIHNGYFYKWRTFADYLPILVGDELVFYTNFDSDTYFDGKTIGIVEEDGCGNYNIITDANKYDLTTTNWGSNNLKIELSIPNSNTENLTNFRLAILGEATSTGYSIANTFEGDSATTVVGIKKLASGNFIIYGNTITIDSVSSNTHVVTPAGARVGSYNFLAFDDTINDVVEQADGKLVFVGAFDTYGVNNSAKVVRVNTDGSYDATFAVGSGATSILTLVDKDSAGNIYIASNSSFFYNGSGSSTRLAKLSSTGTLDGAYPIITTTPRHIKVDASDKVLQATGGSSGIRRLNSDGTVDGTFTSGLYGGASVDKLDIDGDGNIYVVGNINLGSDIEVGKLSSTGSVISAFSPVVEADLKTVRVESDGIYVGGVDNAYVLNSTTGVASKSITFTGTVGSFLKNGSNFLFSSVPAGTISIGETSAVFGAIEELFVQGVDYVSNYFTVLQATEKNINNTHLLSFYHISNIFNYEWAGFDSVADDYYTIRVSSSKVGIEYPTEREFYNEATTGRPRTTRSLTKKQISFEIYFATEDLHDAISIFTSFKYFGINGNEYLAEALEVDYNKNFNLFKSVLTLKDVEFDKRVNICNTLS